MKEREICIRITYIAALLFMVFVIIGLPWYFSNKNGTDSNQISLKLTYWMQFIFDKYSIVHKNASYTLAMNTILRKLAHFIEYLFIGSLITIIMNQIMKKIWLTAFLSIFSAFSLAYFDELHQLFVLGRTQRLFDIYIDCFGALIGVILISIFFMVYRYIKSLKKIISELEKQKNPKENYIIDDI